MGRRRMASPYIFDMLVMLVAVASALTVLCSSQDDFFQCENTVKNWAASSHADGVKGVRLTLHDLLFFLHVPRTGGRTYFHCFLNKLYTSDLKCPRSYDRLRFNPRLLVTHDDYSVMSKLPKESTSVVTILRDPVDRVFSTYEFSVEVAARFLVHPNLTSATKMTGRIRPKSHGVSTLDIWPWKYLVPWMREDLFGRREARKLRKVMGVRNGGDSYDMEDIVMPLRAFINDPLAHEIIHNGATFQVAGLTNNSYLTESREVRQCVRKHHVLGQYVLDVAKERLDNMLYVGLTEEHKESATIFANAVGVQVLSLLETLGSYVKKAVDNRTELSSSFPDSDLDTSSQLENSINGQQTRGIESTDENTAVAKLIEDYEVCVSSLRKSQAVRRVSSLKRISPVNFTKEARLQVPEAVIQQIMSLNSLDMELYKHAQNIFAKQQKHLAQRAVKAEIQESSFGCCAWEVTLLAIITILFTVAFIFRSVISRRNMKLKI